MWSVWTFVSPYTLKTLYVHIRPDKYKLMSLRVLVNLLDLKISPLVNLSYKLFGKLSTEDCSQGRIKTLR